MPSRPCSCSRRSRCSPSRTCSAAGSNDGRAKQGGQPMKRIAAVIALGLLPALVAPASAAEDKALQLFNWSNYMSPDLLKRFETETGIKVTLDTYDTNESMLAKLQAGGGGYDVVVPTGPTVQQMIRDGLLLKVEAGSMANYKNVKKPFDNPDFDPGRAYS